MSIADGIITAPVSIEDVRQATGNAARDVWRLIVGSAAAPDVNAFDPESGIQIKNRNPKWNVFSLNSPAEWVITDVLGTQYYLPKIKKATYLPSNIRVGASLEMFRDYDHNTPVLSFIVPTSVASTGTTGTVAISYEIPQHLHANLLGVMQNEMGKSEENVYWLLLGGGEIKGRLNYMSMTHDTGRKVYTANFTPSFTGLPIYQDTYEYVEMEIVLAEYKDSGSTTALTSYNELCRVGGNEELYHKQITFYGTLVDDTPHYYSVPTGSWGYASAAYWVRQSADYIDIHILDLMADRDIQVMFFATDGNGGEMYMGDAWFVGGETYRDFALSGMRWTKADAAEYNNYEMRVTEF